MYFLFSPLSLGCKQRTQETFLSAFDTYCKKATTYQHNSRFLYMGL